MKQCRFLSEVLVLPLVLLIVGCGSLAEPKSKTAPLGLITTPTSYYSTYKARSLGEKYKANLDRLVERIVRNPKTANLQFANNIASVGGIGFFTHSAAAVPDARYLEVVLSVPETFEGNGEYSLKLNRLFSLYGTELLSMLLNDSDIYEDKEVSGYGLNFSWRNVAREPTGARVTLERAVAYFSKQKAHNFLRQELTQNALLRDAVIFAVEEDGPMRLVTYRPEEPKPDFRPPIQEETLADMQVKPKSEAKSSTAEPLKPQVVAVPKTEKEPQRVAAIEKPPSVAVQTAPIEKKKEGAATSSAPKKIDTSTIAVDKPEAETVKPNQTLETRPVKPPVATDKVDETPALAIKVDNPRMEVASPVPQTRTETSQSSSKAETLEDRQPSAPAARPTEMLKKETDEVMAKPELVNKTGPTGATPSMVIDPSFIGSMPADEGREENQGKSGEEIVETRGVGSAKSIEPSLQVHSEEVRTPEPVIVASKQEVKVPTVSQSLAPKTERSEKEEASVPQLGNPIVPIAEAPKTADQLQPRVEGTSEPSVVAATEELQVPGVSQPIAEKMMEPKSTSPIMAIPGAAKLPDQSNTVEEKASEPAAVASKPEIKSVPVMQQHDERITAPKDDKSQETEETGKVEVVAKAGQLSHRNSSIEDSQSNPAIVAPKSELKPTVVETVPPKIATTTEGNAASGAKAEAKIPDSVSVQENKPETIVETSNVDVEAPETKSQEKVATRQESPQPLSRPWPVEQQSFETPSTPTNAEVKGSAIAPPRKAKVSEKPANDELALLTRRPIEALPEKKPLPRPKPKALEGFIIQLSFAERGEAQRWAENLTGQGYAVSMTEADNGNAFRVRIGNFAARSDAERRLKTLGQNGLKGIVLNLPQAYSPEVSQPAAEATGQTIAVTQ